MKLIETIKLDSNSNIDYGVFYALWGQGFLPFFEDIEDVHAMDFDYYYNRSGNKKISLLYQKLLEQYKNKEDTDGIVMKLLVKIIWNRYYNNWLKIWDAYTQEYNALHNYDMTENENIKESQEIDDTKSSTIKRNIINQFDKYGFNTTDTPVPQSKSTEIANPDDNENTESYTGSKDNTFTKELSRKGNIGVTTTQKMLKEELEVRKYNFFEQVMTDIDSVLCQKIYEF